MIETTDPHTNNEEFDQAVKNADVLKALVDALVGGTDAILGITDLLKKVIP